MKAPTAQNGWHISPLGDVVTLQRGFDLPQRLRRHGNVPVVSSAGVTAYHCASMVGPPGVVTGRYGTIGELFFVEEPFWPLNTTLYAREFHGNDERFVYYLLHRFDFVTYSGKSGVPGVNRNDLHSEPVALPIDVNEQRAVAEALSDVDALLAGLDRLIAKKRDLKQTVMQQLLTGQTRLPRFTADWHVRRLGDVAQLNRIHVIPAGDPDQTFVHFSLPAFDHDRSAQTELGSEIGSNKFRVPQHAVLVSKLNPRIPRVWAPKVIPPNSVASTEWLVLTPYEGTERDFLYAVCRSPSFVRCMELAATGTTGSHQRIDPKTALDILVSMPGDRAEQTAIATLIADVDDELASLHARREKTLALKEAMMQELLTGRIRLI